MSKHDTIGIAAIGCGKRLRTVLKQLLEQDPRLRLVAAYDPSPGSLDSLAEAVGAPFTRTHDWQDALRDPAVDWVMVSSPNVFHAEQAIGALEAGKHVFCEKPLATDFDSCLRIRDAVRRSGRRFAFGLVLRYAPFYQRVHALMAEEAIGTLISFEFNETLGWQHGGYIFGNWRRNTAQAGSHILEKTCHDLDLANWLIGSLPVRVASFGGRRFFVPENAHLAESIGPDAQGRPAFQQWEDPERVDPFSAGGDLMDHQVVILEYANGVRATFHTNAATALPERRFYLCGTTGTLRADSMAPEISLRRMGHDTETQRIDVATGDGHAGGDIAMTSHLARTMLDDTTPLAGIDEGIRSAAVAFAIDEALATGSVVDLRPYWERAGLEPDEAGGFR